jgi:phage gp45-like
MMQEVAVKVFHDEETQTLEHFHPYGFTAVPKPPDGKKKAEGVVIFPNGSRSHGLVIVVGDRRYRLTQSKPGEVAIHDDQKQKVHLTRAGIVLDGGPSKLPVNVTVGNATLTVADGKITTTVDKLTIVLTAEKICLGSADASDAVMLQSGPSTKIYGVP